MGKVSNVGTCGGILFLIKIVNDYETFLGSGGGGLIGGGPGTFFGLVLLILVSLFVTNMGYYEGWAVVIL